MEPEKRHKIIKYSLAVIAILVAVAFCIGIIYAVADYYANENVEAVDSTTVGKTVATTTILTTAEGTPSYDPLYPEILGGDILTYFGGNDGVNVTFVHGANSIAEMEDALQDDNINLLEADITLRYYGTQNQTTEPIMAHPPSFNSDNSLKNWFENVIPSKKGIKMDIKVEEVIPYALEELRMHGRELTQPVWINADVIQGPNTPSSPINGTYFIENVNDIFPDVTLSLGWSTGYRLVGNNDEYSWESMDEMLALSKSTTQRITFPLRAALGKESWYKFLWLLEQEERFSLTVWSASTDPITKEAKMYLRDNYDLSKVFYDTDPGFTDDIKMEDQQRTIPKLFYTGGNVLDFLRIPERDAMQVTWVHRVNHKADLENALKTKPNQIMEPEKRHKIIKYSLAVIAIFVAVAFCIGIIYAVADYYANENVEAVDSTTVGKTVATTTILTTAEGTPSYEPSYPEILGGDILTYFGGNDGVNVTFVHGANSIAEMEGALQDENINMLEADITLRYYGTQNQTTEPIMAHPPSFNSDNSLKNWFENVIPSKKGIKMDIKVEEVIPYALEELRMHGRELTQPVWINADVIQGPNTPSSPINGTYFIENVNDIFPDVTLSLGWSTGYRLVGNNDEYSWESMDEMLALSKSTTQRITFPIRAALGKQSWYKFLWLLEQEERFSLTVWSATTDPITKEDKMYLRDNYDLSKVFYDTDPGFTDDIKMEDQQRTIPKLFYTGGNVLDFLRIPDRDAMQVTWVHRVNHKADLENALRNDSIMMLEADVRLKNETPVMAHDASGIVTSDLTLEEWLLKVSNSSKKGIKLDFKSTDVLEASFQIMSNMSSSLTVPVWVNSDILRGPNSVAIPVNATEFFSKVQTIFPHATLSTGWTTYYKLTGNNEGYSQAMVEEMYQYCSQVRQAITFPVRASLTAQSIPQLQWLVGKSNRFSLTVWHSGVEEVPTDDLVKIHDSFDKSRVYYDLPDDMMNAFIDAINNK